MAIALAADPDILFADEPTTALDVTIQAQILDLLREIQMKLGTATILVSHDLGVVARVADRVAVMYAGKIVEIGTREDIFKHPKHPYTKALFSATPAFTKAEKEHKSRIILQGDVPSPVDPAPGCRFRTRCPYATDRCRQEAPELLCVSGEHKVACFLLEKPEPEQP